MIPLLKIFLLQEKWYAYNFHFKSYNLTHSSKTLLENSAVKEYFCVPLGILEFTQTIVFSSIQQVAQMHLHSCFLSKFWFLFQKHNFIIAGPWDALKKIHDISLHIRCPSKFGIIYKILYSLMLAYLLEFSRALARKNY